MKEELGLSPSMPSESDTEEWWFHVRPKGVGNRRLRPIGELFSESSKSSMTSDATTARWYEAFMTRGDASQFTRQSERSRLSETQPRPRVSTRPAEEKSTALVPIVEAGALAVSPRTQETPHKVRAHASDRLEPKDRPASGRRCHRRPR